MLSRVTNSWIYKQNLFLSLKMSLSTNLSFLFNLCLPLPLLLHLYQLLIPFLTLILSLLHHIDTQIIEDHFSDLPEVLSVFLPTDIIDNPSVHPEPSPVPLTAPSLAAVSIPLPIEILPRRSTKISKPPTYLQSYKCNAVSTRYPIANYVSNLNLSPSYSHFCSSISVLKEPTYYYQAVGDPNWEAAMATEIQALELNNTWYVVPLPSNKQAVGCKWVFKIKYKSDGTMERYKSRLVAKGYTQQEGLDYTETFSPVAKMVAVKLFLALVAVQGWTLQQLDVNNAFLHGDLHEEVYMSIPSGLHSKGELVCKLNKSFYGLGKHQGNRFPNSQPFSCNMVSYNLRQIIHCLSSNLVLHS